MQRPAIGEDTEKLFVRALGLVQRVLDTLPKHETHACAQVLLDWLVWSRTHGKTPTHGMLHDRATRFQAMLTAYVGCAVPMGQIDAVLAKVRTWMGSLAPVLQLDVSDWERCSLQAEQDMSRVKKRIRVHVQLRTVNEESLALGAVETWVDSQAAVQNYFQVEETPMLTMPTTGTSPRLNTSTCESGSGDLDGANDVERDCEGSVPRDTGLLALSQDISPRGDTAR